MRQHTAEFALFLLGGVLVLGLLTLAWAIGPRSSEAQQDSMHNCPQAGNWAISVWSGDDGTDTGEALAACGPGAVDFAYYIDPDTQQWLRYFVGRAEISNLLTLDDMQGVIAHGPVGAPTPTATLTPTPMPTATPTPAPTATPTPVAGGFSVSKTSDYISITGSLWVVGEVKNNNAFNAEFVKIEATFFDAADRVVASEYSYSCLDIIPPGGDSPFDILLWDPPANIARYTLQAYDEPAREPPPSGLDISGVSTRLSGAGYYHVTGLITNNSSDTYEFVGVCGALYDSAGRVFRTGHTYIGPDTLAPGQSASFDFSESVDSTPVASYRLWVDAERV